MCIGKAAKGWCTITVVLGLDAGTDGMQAQKLRECTTKAWHCQSTKRGQVSGNSGTIGQWLRHKIRTFTVSLGY